MFISWHHSSTQHWDTDQIVLGLLGVAVGQCSRLLYCGLEPAWLQSWCESLPFPLEMTHLIRIDFHHASASNCETKPTRSGVDYTRMPSVLQLVNRDTVSSAMVQAPVILFLTPGSPRKHLVWPSFCRVIAFSATSLRFHHMVNSSIGSKHSALYKYFLLGLQIAAGLPLALKILPHS